MALRSKSSSTSSNETPKKNMSLKNLKKAQKDKRAAKRASAAANFKVKKNVVSKDDPMTVAHFEAGPAAGTGAGTGQADADIHTQPTTALPTKAEDDALPSEVIDIHAYRKALEAALYENMETPMQMLIRVNFKVSVDTEHHKYGEDGEPLPDEEEVEMKCRDGNGFEITPIVSDLPECAEGVSASTTVESVDSQQEDTSTGRPLTMDEVFSKVNSEGVSVVGSSGSKSSSTLKSVELELTTRPITTGHLFTLVSQSGKKVLRAANMNDPSCARSVDSIARKMTTVCYDTQPKPSHSRVDSAIISSNSQPGSPASSRHEPGYCTPFTRYSISPLAGAGPNQGPPASFGECNSIWSKPIWAENFAEPPYTCATQAQLQGQSFFAGPMAHRWPFHCSQADQWQWQPEWW